MTFNNHELSTITNRPLPSLTGTFRQDLKTGTGATVQGIETGSSAISSNIFQQALPVKLATKQVLASVIVHLWSPPQERYLSATSLAQKTSYYEEKPTFARGVHRHVICKPGARTQVRIMISSHSKSRFPSSVSSDEPLGVLSSESVHKNGMR